MVGQIRRIGKDPALREATFAAAFTQGKARLEELSSERRGLERDIERGMSRSTRWWQRESTTAARPTFPGAPDIQEAILFLPRTERGRDPIILRDLQPIASILDCLKQRTLRQQFGKHSLCG